MGDLWSEIFHFDGLEARREKFIFYGTEGNSKSSTVVSKKLLEASQWMSSLLLVSHACYVLCAIE